MPILLLKKDGIRTVVQAKRYKGKVGVKAIQEVIGAKGYYNCDRAMVITNSYFTRQAKELADKNGVELWNRIDLANNLLKIKKEGEIKVDESQSVCVICGVTVSDRVRQYCLSHPEKFGGKIYCYRHQREIDNLDTENIRRKENE